MKYKKIMIALAATAALSAAGCGSSSKDTVEVTPTPVPTAAPTSTPATASPLPTSTPAPKLIGVKTSTAKFVYLSNSTKGEVREIYLREPVDQNGVRIWFRQSLRSRQQNRYRCITHRNPPQMLFMI